MAGHTGIRGRDGGFRRRTCVRYWDRGSWLKRRAAIWAGAARPGSASERARTPAEAIREMTVPHGFSVEVVAAEPDIVNPVAMTFDERGRVWITESLEYPRRAAGPGRDRVKVLEDTDGDGKADKFTVFAEGLNIPSGIAVGHGGVWVANSPDILFLKDTRRRRQGRHARGGRDGFGRSRYPRAAQLADLGARRLALWLERRIQPRQGRLEERQDI